MKRLAIVVTHPIQYYAPVFKLLSASPQAQVRVFYTWGKESIKKYDPGFQREIEWDIPVMEGYEYVFLENTSRSPGTSAFSGIVNPEIGREIKNFDPHAILVYGWSWNSHLKVLRTFAGKKPIWFRGDSNLLDTSKGFNAQFRSLFLSWVYTHIDLAFYVGSANKAYYQKFGLKDHQLMWAPHAIDNERFRVDRSEEARKLRIRLGIPQDALLILFAGKLEPKKDPTALIEAFSQLHHRNCYLLMVGNGVLETKAWHMANESVQRDRILFLDFQNQEQMPVVYQSCDVFCLPSKGPGETWGLAVNEAMACGKAVIVSNKAGCARDLVRDGANGAVFEAGNVMDLRMKMEALLTDASSLPRMGLKSLEIIDTWTFENQARSILQELEKI